MAGVPSFVRGGRAAACVWRPEDAEGAPTRVPGATRNALFGKDKRIGRSAEFEALLRAGTRRGMAGFTFYFSRRESGSARLGILISRKHASRATDRNRFKRYIREAFRLEQVGLGPIDLLVRPPYGIKPTAELVLRLRSCLMRLAK